MKPKKTNQQNAHLSIVRVPTRHAKIPKQLLETGIAAVETWSMMRELGMHTGRVERRKEKDTRQR